MTLLNNREELRPWSARGRVKVECVTPGWLVDGKFYDGNKGARPQIDNEFWKSKRHCSNGYYSLRREFTFILVYLSRWKLSQILSPLVPSCLLFCVC